MYKLFVTTVYRYEYNTAGGGVATQVIEFTTEEDRDLAIIRFKDSSPQSVTHTCIKLS